jgi:hypothetical protein
MVRSSGIPRQKGVFGITRIIRARARAKTFERVTTSQGTLDETTTSTSEYSVDVWLFEPRENIAEELAGERINGSLGGLVVADDTIDIDRDDRITYGGVEYEVDTIVGHPEDGDADGTASPDTEFWLLSFVRRQ